MISIQSFIFGNLRYDMQSARHYFFLSMISSAKKISELVQLSLCSQLIVLSCLYRLGHVFCTYDTIGLSKNPRTFVYSLLLAWSVHNSIFNCINLCINIVSALKYRLVVCLPSRVTPSCLSSYSSSQISRNSRHDMPLILFGISAHKAHVLFEEILHSAFLLCRKMNGF